MGIRPQLSSRLVHILRQGAAIKYVRTEGGEGVQKSADFADKQSYRSADKGGRGSKNPKICGRT